MFDLIINYLKQPSTYAGICALLAAFGLTFSDELTAAVSTAAIAVIGVIEVIRKEHTESK